MNFYAFAKTACLFAKILSFLYSKFACLLKIMHEINALNYYSRPCFA